MLARGKRKAPSHSPVQGRTIPIELVDRAHKAHEVQPILERLHGRLRRSPVEIHVESGRLLRRGEHEPEFSPILGPADPHAAPEELPLAAARRRHCKVSTATEVLYLDATLQQVLGPGFDRDVLPKPQRRVAGQRYLETEVAVNGRGFAVLENAGVLGHLVSEPARKTVRTLLKAAVSEQVVALDMQAKERIIVEQAGRALAPLVSLWRVAELIQLVLVEPNGPARLGPVQFAEREFDLFEGPIVVLVRVLEIIPLKEDPYDCPWPVVERVPSHQDQFLLRSILGATQIHRRHTECGPDLTHESVLFRYVAGLHERITDEHHLGRLDARGVPEPVLVRPICHMMSEFIAECPAFPMQERFPHGNELGIRQIPLVAGQVLDAQPDQIRVLPAHHQLERAQAETGREEYQYDAQGPLFAAHRFSRPLPDHHVHLGMSAGQVVWALA